MLSAVRRGEVTTNRYQYVASATLTDLMQHVADFARSKRTARDENWSTVGGSADPKDTVQNILYRTDSLFYRVGSTSVASNSRPHLRIVCTALCLDGVERKVR